MVAFLGTDGVGKSTVITRIERDLAPAFIDTKRYHRRPLASARRWRKQSHLNQKGGGEHNAHAQSPRNLAVSLAKLGFWWADYMFLGYIGDIFPRLVRGTLVLLDRYYHDLLVYPKRYRYGGPLRLARFVGQLIPKPHLVILLDAPPEVIQSRRQEVPFEETARQREAYLKVVENLPNSHVVDASKPLDDVVTEVEGLILDYMTKRQPAN